MKLKHFFFNKTYFLFFVAIVSFYGCSTKQKVTQIPTSANKVATNNNQETSISAKSSDKDSPKISEEAITQGTLKDKPRGESFGLVEGDAAMMNKKFHVVVGVFKNVNNAKKISEQLKEQNNNPLIVINDKGMYRVIISSYDEYSQARTKIDQISKTYKDAWVLIQK